MNWPIREEIGKSSKFNKSSNLKIWRIFGFKGSLFIQFIIRIYYCKYVIVFKFIIIISKEIPFEHICWNILKVIIDKKKSQTDRSCIINLELVTFETQVYSSAI